MENLDDISSKPKAEQRKTMQPDEPIKPSYDFSTAERGKFYVEDAEFRLPRDFDTKPNIHTVFIENLDELCNLIERSDDSVYAHLTRSEIIQVLQSIKNDFSQTGAFDKVQLDFLLAPTGSIQEISMNNHWGEKFVQLAQKIEAETNSK